MSRRWSRKKPTRPDESFAKPKPEKVLFKNTDFTFADDHSHSICPAGKRMYCSGRYDEYGGYQSIRLRTPKCACRDCPLRAQCIRKPDQSAVRQVAFILGRAKNVPEKYMDKMKRKIDSDHGRYQYSRRLGTVETVFTNIRHTHRLNRFSLRGRTKVNTQWQLFCLVHNIGKVQHYGSRAMTTKNRKRRKAA